MPPLKGRVIGRVPLVAIRGLNNEYAVGLGVYTRQEAIVRAVCRHPEILRGANWRCYYQAVSSDDASLSVLAVEPVSLLTETQRTAVDCIVTSAVWCYGIALGLRRGLCWPDGVSMRVRQRVINTTMTHMEASVRLLLHYESLGESWKDAGIRTPDVTDLQRSDRNIPDHARRAITPAISFGLPRDQLYTGTRCCMPTGFLFHPLMVNPSSHCFLHVVLHMLFASAYFRAAILRDNGSPQLHPHNGRFSGPLTRLLVALQAGQGENELSQQLTAFKTVLPDRYSGSRPQDAAEFIMYLLDAVDTELRGSAAVAGVASDEIMASSDLSWGRHFSGSSSMLGTAMCCQLRADRKCHLRLCYGVSIGHDHPMCLQLAF